MRDGGRGVPRFAMRFARPAKKFCWRPLVRVGGGWFRVELGCDMGESRKDGFVAEFGVCGSP